MTFTEKHIVETYSGMFEGLNTASKMELIEALSKSLQRIAKNKENAFYKSFGAFGSEKPAEEITRDIKQSNFWLYPSVRKRKSKTKENGQANE
jgi:hypothetical protein